MLRVPPLVVTATSSVPGDAPRCADSMMAPVTVSELFGLITMILTASRSLSRVSGYCRSDRASDQTPARRRLGAQIPDDADHDQAGAEEHERIERLSVEEPADERDERDPHEIERNHDDGVASAKRVGESEVRRQA